MGDTGQPEGALNHDRLIDDHAVADADAGGDDLAGFLYRRNRPRQGVMLSHRNLIYNAINAEATFGYGAKPRYLHAAPMFHAADLMNLMPSRLSGHHTFLSAFDPAAALQLLRDEAVNVTIGADHGQHGGQSSRGRPSRSPVRWSTAPRRCRRRCCAKGSRPSRVDLHSSLWDDRTTFAR